MRSRVTISESVAHSPPNMADGFSTPFSDFFFCFRVAAALRVRVIVGNSVVVASLLKVGVGWAYRFFCYMPRELPSWFNASLRLKLFTADKQESLTVAFYWTIEVLLENMPPLGSPCTVC